MNTTRARWLLLLLVLATAVPSAVVAFYAPGVGDRLTLLLPISFLATGSVVVWRQPQNLEAWLIAGTGTAWALALALPFDGSWVVPVCLMTVHLPLRFPNGRLPSHRWRIFSRLCVALTVILPFVVTAGSRVTAENAPNPYCLAWVGPLTVLLALLPVAMVVSAASLVARYRRSDSLERHQVRWIAWAGAWIVTIYCITLAVSLNFDRLAGKDSTKSNWLIDYPLWLTALQYLALASFLLIPVSFSIAILRYRLYDIDRIISRTAAYTLVTGAIAATYVIVVTLATHVLPGSSALATAVATLTAAALVRPLLKRVQAARPPPTAASTDPVTTRCSPSDRSPRESGTPLTLNS